MHWKLECAYMYSVTSKIPASEHTFLLGDLKALLGAVRDSCQNGIRKMYENAHGLFFYLCYPSVRRTPTSRTRNAKKIFRRHWGQIKESKVALYPLCSVSVLALSLSPPPGKEGAKTLRKSW